VLDPVLEQERVEQALDDAPVRVGHLLDLAELAQQLPVLEAGLGGLLARALHEVVGRDVEGASSHTRQTLARP
jgi:hypothetical protein